MTLRLLIPRIRWPSARITVFGLTIGVSVVGLLSFIYLRRRNRRRYLKKDESSLREEIFVAGQIQTLPRSGTATGSYRGSSCRSRRAGSISSRASTMRGSGRSKTASAVHGHEDDVNGIELTAEDCGLFGLKALRQVIDNLEDALYDFKQFEEHFSTPLDHNQTDSSSHGLESSSTKGYATPDSVSHAQSLALMQDLKKLLQEAYMVKERWKQNVIMQTDMSDVVSDICNERDLDYDDDDDTESFVSASEFIDLSDLDELLKQAPVQERYLYRTGLLEIDQGNITCRTMRTRLVGCETDSEFLAKVHCLRIAFDKIFSDTKRRTWVKTVLRAASGRFLESLGFTAERFYPAFDNMMEFLESQRARTLISEELGPRGVKCVNFYDIAFDFMLLDSLEDLENPPSSLLSVIGNRWLSSGFKKTALESAVWTILLTKRKFLKNQDGFISNYYSIAAETSPALAWGFLGPEEDLQTMCHDFKNQLISFVQNLFSFAKVRYTTVDEMSEDVFTLLKDFATNLSTRFAPDGS